MRKLWAVSEVCCAFGAWLKLLVRAQMVWNIREPNGIYGTPLKYAALALDKRIARGCLALYEPKKDKALLRLSSLLGKLPEPQRTATEETYKRIEDLILDPYVRAEGR